MKLVNLLLEAFSDTLYEMSNLSNKSTGLDRVIYISTKAGAMHGPRVKVYNSSVGRSRSTSISISDNPKVVTFDGAKIGGRELKKIKEWITLNKEVLLKHWNSEQGYQTSDEVIPKLKRL